MNSWCASCQISFFAISSSANALVLLLRLGAHASNAAQTRRTTSQNVYDTPGQWLVTHSWASGVQRLGSGAGGMQSTYLVLGQTSETPPPQEASIPTATTNKILSRILPPAELKL